MWTFVRTQRSTCPSALIYCHFSPYFHPHCTSIIHIFFRSISIPHASHTLNLMMTMLRANFSWMSFTDSQFFFTPRKIYFYPASMKHHSVSFVDHDETVRDVYKNASKFAIQYRKIHCHENIINSIDKNHHDCIVGVFRRWSRAEWIRIQSFEKTDKI